MVDNVDDIASSVEDAEHRAGRLQSSYYALIAWVGVVTAAVIAATAVTLYRRARRPSAASLDASSVSAPIGVPSPAPTIDAVERCSSAFDETLPEVSEVVSASELGSDASATVCDDRNCS